MSQQKQNDSLRTAAHLIAIIDDTVLGGIVKVLSDQNQTFMFIHYDLAGIGLLFLTF